MASFYIGIALLFSWITNTPLESNENELSLLFIGDIMGHGPQIKGAYNDSTKTYSYNDMFTYIKDEVSDADFTIANLEVTLAGKPYQGYPKFSSPDALALACKNNGIDGFVMANNHSCDRGDKGIIRSIEVVEKLNLLHTGTFKNKSTRDSLNLLILEKNNIKVGILNYTYGTNGLSFGDSVYVNLIDTTLMAKDIAKAKQLDIDKLIVFTHWGGEYKEQPDNYQLKTAQFLFSKNVDIIIGSHPHVLQKMIYVPKSESQDKLNESFIVYSLGNYVSNQRDRRKDGGCMVKLILQKNEQEVRIKECGYLLTWVYRRLIDSKYNYQILPCSKFENDSMFFDKKEDFQKMNVFIDDSRKLLDENNLSVSEYIFKENQWIINDE
ncbi:MAG: capsule biosynthesis protein CapA [Crocinitomicaceae bacterium]|nr:capsule biosynthesis protein CapA [Crocinitomicaceae bacterium]|tara:strand:- start:1666 stop:2808 length:1143 start_codon:yes stop_codon:yes gene_type:complete